MKPAGAIELTFSLRVMDDSTNTGDIRALFFDFEGLQPSRGRRERGGGYAYDIVGGNGGSVAQTATITLIGANDDPVVTAAIAAATSTTGHSARGRTKGQRP